MCALCISPENRAGANACVHLARVTVAPPIFLKLLIIYFIFLLTYCNLLPSRGACYVPADVHAGSVYTAISDPLQR